MNEYMDNIHDKPTKAFWIQSVRMIELSKRNSQMLHKADILTKFAFGVGMTSLTASLISLGIVILNYGT